MKSRSEMIDGYQRTKLTFTAGHYVDYTYDGTGQLKTANGKESGGTARPHEQFGYAYDKAWNLSFRTNNALVQTFGVTRLNELATLSRDGTLTLAGAVSTTPASVTVKDNANSAQSAAVYGDNTEVGQIEGQYEEKQLSSGSTKQVSGMAGIDTNIWVLASAK